MTNIPNGEILDIILGNCEPKHPVNDLKMPNCFASSPWQPSPFKKENKKKKNKKSLTCYAAYTSL